MYNRARGRERERERKREVRGMNDWVYLYCDLILGLFLWCGHLENTVCE